MTLHLISRVQVNASLVKVNMTLSPWVEYNFRLIAYNKMGASDPSFPSPVPCITKSARPEYHPQNLRTIGHQPGKLYIEWTVRTAPKLFLAEIDSIHLSCNNLSDNQN